MKTLRQVLESQDHSKSSKRSLEWYLNQARFLETRDLTPQKFLNRQPKYTHRQISLGNLYLFRYYPKGVGKLPMWDMYPLVMPFKVVEGGFLGINFHYLGYKQRSILLGYMLRFSKDQATSSGAMKMNENTRLRFEWQDLTRNRYIGYLAKQAIKKYLVGRVTSEFKKIDARNWGTILELPLENFIYDETPNGR